MSQKSLLRGKAEGAFMSNSFNIEEVGEEIPIVNNMGKYFSSGTKLRARLSLPPRPVPHQHLTPTVVMA